MYTRMQLHNGQQQTEASAPPSPVLSVGFWDAFAAGCMWSEPVLAALSFSPLGKDHILYVLPLAFRICLHTISRHFTLHLHIPYTLHTICMRSAVRGEGKRGGLYRRIGRSLESSSAPTSLQFYPFCRRSHSYRYSCCCSGGGSSFCSVLAYCVFSSVLCLAIHLRVLATDGSIQVKTKENTPSKKNAADGAKEQQEEQQQHLAGGGGEQQQSEENRSRYQYGRLLMRRETVPCKPEFLINKYLSLAVYSKCSLKCADSTETNKQHTAST